MQNLIAPKKVEQIDRLLDTLFEKEDWMKAIEESVPPKFLELNKKAFSLGRSA